MMMCHAQGSHQKFEGHGHSKVKCDLGEDCICVWLVTFIIEDEFEYKFVEFNHINKVFHAQEPFQWV